MIAGGGTGGHLFPVLAIADALDRRFPGVAVHLVGSKFGLESSILQNRGNSFTLVGIRGFARGLTLRGVARNIGFPFRFLLGYLKMRFLISDFEPHVVVGTGGYASGLPLLAAIHKDIPTLVHEQNSYPGFTTRWLSSRVHVVCLSYAESGQYLKKKSSSLRGIP